MILIGLPRQSLQDSTAIAVEFLHGHGLYSDLICAFRSLLCAANSCSASADLVRVCRSVLCARSCSRLVRYLWLHV
jgi:hypothetical protein